MVPPDGQLRRLFGILGLLVLTGCSASYGKPDPTERRGQSVRHTSNPQAVAGCKFVAVAERIRMNRFADWSPDYDVGRIVPDGSEDDYIVLTGEQYEVYDCSEKVATPPG